MNTVVDVDEMAMKLIHLAGVSRVFIPPQKRETERAAGHYTKKRSELIIGQLLIFQSDIFERNKYDVEKLHI